ncbi:hypothetical protein IQ260_05090 [Leptolyngbya cf. ectocarpi LEGE 11479]|uniref:Uncharacterized protein n=1 Tax=Leptolyngbya cf. ectocarpi LEGE 11479 TaxID=1828722 RepID=A0A928X3T3_LEPEC|nr:hypothetical protein [Leptolyngbya ectocarpi]MBE9066023.1 hypothetical protein [Leptolyngbya cf. ectocarpi LEGE 11479]
MISTLFAQFRHQYANGSLTTELLNTHAEQYLVKATVSIDEQIVATALAADTNLTVADDHAKARVLALLGFGQAAEAPQQAAVKSANAKPDIPTTKTVSPPTKETAIEPPIQAPDKTDDLADAETGEHDSEDMGRPIDSIAPEEAPAPSEVPASSLAAAAIENFDDSSPVDLSDIIAQTDVEMARLGWSSLQGRTYLEKTFNKRSRQQLTDEELLTFLLYLESQTTPSMG